MPVISTISSIHTWTHFSELYRLLSVCPLDKTDKVLLYSLSSMNLTYWLHMINRQGHSAMRQFRWRKTSPSGLWLLTLYNKFIMLRFPFCISAGMRTCLVVLDTTELRVAEENSFNILFLTPLMLKCMNYGQSFCRNTDRYLKSLTYIKNKCVKIFVDSVQIFVHTSCDFMDCWRWDCGLCYV